MKTCLLLLLLCVTPSAFAVLVQSSYLKASNPGLEETFGGAVAISGDTMVVGAVGEGSNAKGANGNQGNNSMPYAGAVYVFVRDGSTWKQQAYLKASNPDEGDLFGQSVAISGDTIVVGAHQERSSATGINGNQNDNSAENAGAAYVFVRNGATWTQQAYLKGSNTAAGDLFGRTVAVDGDTIVVGAMEEDSNAVGVGGDQNNNLAGESGAAYVFTRSGSTWTQQAYLKASNTGVGDRFAESVAVSGNTIVVGTRDEDSNSSLNQADNSALEAGAAYVFVRTANVWTQQAYLKAGNVEAGDEFGRSVAILGDTLVVGAALEDSNALGVNGAAANNDALDSGAAYVFTRTGVVWSQHSYLKASNTEANDRFGRSVAISSDAILVGAYLEDGSATGVNGTQGLNNATNAGAAYVFYFDSGTWSQQAYLKALNPGPNDSFGLAVGLSPESMVVGAQSEDSKAKGVNGNAFDEALMDAGAAYVFETPVEVSGLAHTGYRAPGGADLFFSKLGAPALDPDGGLLFDAALTGAGTVGGKNQGVFSTLGVPSDLALALQKGAVISDGSLGLPANTKITALTLPQANQVALGLFQATVSGTGLTPANNRVLIKDDGVGVTPIFRTGGAPIASLDNATLKSVLDVAQDPTQNVIGLSYVCVGGTPAANAASDSGLLLIDHNGAVMSAAAREGKTAHGGGGNFGQFAPRASLTTTTDPLFIAKFTAATPASKPLDAWFEGSTRVPLLQGDNAPGFASTQKLGAFLTTLSGGTNAYLRAMITGIPAAQNEAVYDRSASIILRKGAALAPLTETVAKIIRFWAVGDQIVFHLQLSGPGVTPKNNMALVLRQAPGGQFQYLARTGMVAPGFPSSVTMSALSAVDVDPVNGHYAILAALSGIGTSGNQALLRGTTSLGNDTPAGQLARLPQRVLRKGQIYSSALTPLGIVKGINLSPAADPSGAGGRGLRQVINDDGAVAVTIIGDKNTQEHMVVPPAP